jgi:signal transduction histidine kinase
VKDHGIGIAPEDQARIFGPFERAVSGRHYGGFGLGLWIVRQVVEAHGGAVRLESSPGQGSTFFVDLPSASE